MDQQLRTLFVLVFLPAVLSAVHGVDLPADAEDDIGTNTTHTPAARWSVTIRRGGHGGHGHGHGHGRGHGNGGGNGYPHESPNVFNPRTITGGTNYHHRRSAAPGPELGRPSTTVATTCCVVLLIAAIPLPRP